MDFGEVRTSGVSSRLEPGGDVRTTRVERIDIRNVHGQTPLGSLRAASVELAQVELRLATSPADAPFMQRVRAATVGELRVRDARVEAEAAALAGMAGSARGGRWRIEPLGSLEGSLHADIVDAAWIFDADVTIPVGGGRIDFNRATVEHVGPDSSMGVSRMGVYVDAPSGRTYLVLFSATHVPGARFERREGGLLPGWRGDRGSIELQPLLECVLSGLPLGTPATGMRDMVARTRLRGEFQLGDGVVGDARRRVVLDGRDRGRNRVAVSSLPSGGGVALRMADLSASELHFELQGARVSTGTLSAAMSLQLEDRPGASALTANVAELALHDVRIVGSS
jgi:hypothetical protein